MYAQNQDANTLAISSLIFNFPQNQEKSSRVAFHHRSPSMTAGRRTWRNPPRLILAPTHLTQPISVLVIPASRGERGESINQSTYLGPPSTSPSFSPTAAASSIAQPPQQVCSFEAHSKLLFAFPPFTAAMLPATRSAASMAIRGASNFPKQPNNTTHTPSLSLVKPAQQI